MADCDKKLAGKQKKRIMGKKDNKSTVIGLVESEAVRDMGWEEKEVWRQAEDLVMSLKNNKSDMRVVEVQEAVKEMQKYGKGREWVAQVFGRVDTSERIESSEKHLCIRNSRGRCSGKQKLSSSCCFWNIQEVCSCSPHNLL
jgi:hypothetical protein